MNTKTIGKKKAEKNESPARTPSACGGASGGASPVCPECGYTGTEVGRIRCDRCFTVLYKSCMECKGCFMK